MPVSFVLNGSEVTVDDDAGSLLDALRDGLGVHSPKDGCSPQGQCGCCTVLVDGSPRVACVTPVRRVAGRTITTVEGLDAPVRDAWAEAFCATGASQCGFCTPGIVLRLEGLRAKGVPEAGPARTGAVERALAAHLCRCTGWRTIEAGFDAVVDGTPVDAAAGRDLSAASRRASMEGRAPQVVGPSVVLGAGGFAADTAPADALVAVPDGDGGWAVAGTVAEARRLAGKVQGRHSTTAVGHPLAVPEGPWAATLQTTWVEPAYLETDASWCVPGGEPASALANGGAFGGKQVSMVGAIARELADSHGRPVRVVLSREDVVRLGPKRPPIAAGIRADGTGAVRAVRAPGVAAAIVALAPGLVVEEVDVVGPPVSASLRAAGWAEAAVLCAAVDGAGSDGRVTITAEGAVRVVAPDGGVASARLVGGAIHVTVGCGDPLDEVVVRSYAVGAAHMALGWVTSEGLAVDPDGRPVDLTIRSFGVLRAADTPPVEVVVEPDDGEPVNGSDAVFAAVAAAVWRAQGLPSAWPTGVALRA